MIPQEKKKPPQGPLGRDSAATATRRNVIPTAGSLAPEVDEFVVSGIDEKPSVLIKALGMAGCYAWMECKLHRLFEEEDYVLIVRQVLRLEISDEVLASGGKLDLTTAKPLMMTGLGKGMNFCTLQGFLAPPRISSREYCLRE